MNPFTHGNIFELYEIAETRGGATGWSDAQPAYKYSQIVGGRAAMVKEPIRDFKLT
jgi:hypothetical protein